jgi:hypothetical protein
MKLSTNHSLTLNWTSKVITVLIITLTILNSKITYAQQNRQKIKGVKVTDLNINFETKGTGFNYLRLENNTAAPRTIRNEQTFSLTDNYANLNFRWKNPLKFTYTWKDSVYIDEQQAALKDFFKRLTPIFNIPDATAATNNSKEIDQAIAKAIGPKNPIDKPSGGFKDYDLTVLYIQLILGQGQLSEQDRIEINKFTPDLKKLESSDIDFQPKAKATFKELFEETDPNNVSRKHTKDGVADIASDNVELWIKSLEENAKLREQLVASLSKMKFSDELFNSLFQANVSKYLDKSKTLNTTNIAVITKLKPIIETLKNSVPDKVKVFAYGDVSDLTKVRTIDLEENKVLQTELIVTEYKLGTDGLSIEKASESERISLKFRGYDRLTFSVSTGLFYGTTQIKGFGTTTNNGDLVVTEDTIQKNTAVTAIFGNINFGIGSRLLAPIIQLGVDPLKTHPFFLLGGGLSFPSVNFAISAGGIWTTEPTLTNLNPGEKITSTTELENDIKNSFQVKPKGWYLGIQYNF